MNKNAIILLSGGLDSVVSLAYIKNLYKNILALTFDYGQKAVNSELTASKNIADFFKIQHKIIDLNWLAEISTSALNNHKEIPNLQNKNLDDIQVTKDTAKSVWVPNRNGLFVNIAACFADAYKYDNIIIGANKEEGRTFKDNSFEFIQSANNTLLYSSNNKITLLAPLINMNKSEIVQEGIKLNIPFQLLYSCYKGEAKHCGKCESCQRLKRALELNNRIDIINKIFN